MQTKIIKNGKVQELVIPKILKKVDLIKAMTESEGFDMKKNFDLPLEITVEKFLDHSNLTICKMIYNI